MLSASASAAEAFGLPVSNYLTWLQRLLRQAFPRHDLRDCCHYHRQDFHAIAATVNVVHRQLRRSGADGDDADELRFRLTQEARLSEDERSTALLLLDEESAASSSPSPMTAAPAADRAGLHEGTTAARPNVTLLLQAR